MKNFFITFLMLTAIPAFAQDLIVPKEGDPMKAFNIEVGEKYLFYQLEQNDEAPIQRIDKNDVIMVRRVDGSVLNLQVDSSMPPTANEKQSPSKNFPEIDESDIHGSLIAKGNCVYIPTDSPLDYEKAGQERLKQLVEEWGYWTVVEKPSQAHFVLHYLTTISSLDLSWLFVRPRRYYTAIPFPSSYYDGFWDSWGDAKKNMGVCVSCTRSNEDPKENIINAEFFFGKLESVVNKKLSKKVEAVLDADNENNNRLKPIQ